MRGDNAAGKVVFSQKLTNGQAAIDALIARAGRKTHEVSWAVDMASGPAGLLLVLPGRLVNRMAGA